MYFLSMYLLRSLKALGWISCVDTSLKLLNILILQPVLSSSVLDYLVHHDKKYPAEYATAENCVEMQVIMETRGCTRCKGNQDKKYPYMTMTAENCVELQVTYMYDTNLNISLFSFSCKIFH